jgi:CobQ-like glutamine amidotransferase family enzyme
MSAKMAAGKASTQNDKQSGKQSNKQLDILVLYPRDMNIYGDTGNILTLRRRAELYGFDPVLHYYNQGGVWPEHTDIVLGGGGQDSGQSKIIDDFHKRGGQLRVLAREGVPMLVVCGLYQLFGSYFETLDGYRLEGIGIFDAYTQGQSKRMIGNIVEESDEFGMLVGFENHSGQTFIRPADTADGDGGDSGIGAITRPLAHASAASEAGGNNGEDGSEGARVDNVIGTYLHGSLLPKNPQVADFLIRTAAERRYGISWESVLSAMTEENKAALADLDATAANARKVAEKRPR